MGDVGCMVDGGWWVGGGEVMVSAEMGEGSS